MSFNLADRQKARWIILGLIGVLVLLAAMVFPGILSDRSRSSQNLKHFEGAIDNGSQTYDHIKSELYVRASRALEAGDARGAEAIYREVIAKYPKDPDGYDALGACLFFQQRYEDAKAEYLRAVGLNSQSVDALYGLGCVAYKENRLAEAKDVLEKALVLDEKNSRCHRVLGLVYEQSGDVPQAISHYERAIALDPSLSADPVIRRRANDLKR